MSRFAQKHICQIGTLTMYVVKYRQEYIAGFAAEITNNTILKSYSNASKVIKLQHAQQQNYQLHIIKNNYLIQLFLNLHSAQTESPHQLPTMQKQTSRRFLHNTAKATVMTVDVADLRQTITSFD
jgi:hypothetical protein